ncbi:universal stress protein [Halorarius litoreus]|uniref:universal stress protein n=1 Tax=Halorarius litoreus TaxID=2962676 RepID=UPI0020CD6030|nr:universal stress protein [Halorarius litoreus]
MTTFLVGTDSAETSEKLLAYLESRVVDGDEVYAVNSLVGGDRSNDKDVLAGTEALEILKDGVGADTHQLIRGNSPQEDLLAFAEDHDIDELVIGIRKRSPTGKMLFGSTAQDLLLETDLPVVAVPLVDAV